MAEATARQIPVSESDLTNDGGGAYAELEVPGDYEAVLKSVEDYDYTDKGKSYGWLFLYAVETPSGASVDFKVYLSFGQNARWKLVSVLQAHDANLEVGVAEVDPNAFVGETIGASIDYPRDDEDQPTSKFREIRGFFSLAEEPEPVEELPQTVIEKVADRPTGVQHDPETDGEKFGKEPDII